MLPPLPFWDNCQFYIEKWLHLLIATAMGIQCNHKGVSMEPLGATTNSHCIDLVLHSL